MKVDLKRNSKFGEMTGSAVKARLGNRRRSGDALNQFTSREVAIGLMLELSVWLSAPITFLTWYCLDYGASSAAFLAHIELVLIVYIFIGAVRLSAAGKIAEVLERTVSSILMTVFLVIFWLYYVLVVAGIHFWGRILSLEVIQAYSSRQLFGLFQALGISPALVFASMLILMVTIFLLIYFFLKRIDWVWLIGRQISVVPRLLIATTLIAVVGIRFFELTANPPINKEEPISLTLYSGQTAHKFQSLGIDRSLAERMDDAADKIRATLVPNQAFEKRNVIVIVVDALRPDRMGVFGAERDTTPFLSKLDALDWFSFKANLHAVCAESSCGLMAISSSRYPHQFSTRAISLSEMLRLNGYEVHLMLSGDHTSFYGLRDLYGQVDSYFDGSDFDGYANDDSGLLEHVADLPEWSGSPVMMQFHLMSAHPLSSRLPEYAIFQPASNYSLPGAHGFQAGVNFYDNGVLQTDAVISEILSVLDKRGYLNDAIVVITADHGEMLGENSQWNHANTVRDPALRIPFLLVSRWGEPASGSIEIEFASQVDIAPTILLELGVEAPASWSGVPLQRPNDRSIVFMRQGHEIGLVMNDRKGMLWKYWHDISTGEEFAFDLAIDPFEERNLVEQVEDEILALWRRELLAVVARLSIRHVNMVTRSDLQTDQQQEEK